jgi:hypothetical protein
MEQGIRNDVAVSSVFYTVLFFISTLFVFGPGTIYLTNTEEFSIDYRDLMVYSSLLAFVGLGILMFGMKAVSLLNNAYLERIGAVLFILSFLLWLQGNMLVWDYGVFDGRDIHWNSKAKYAWIDGSIWLVLLVAALVKFKPVYRFSKRLSVFFAFVQAVSLSVLFVQGAETPSFKKYLIDDAYKFSFSKEKNVVLIILDTFQSDVFQEIINEDKGYHATFDGFTYFRNTLGAFPFTELSVGAILTGQYYDNSLPYESWKKKAFLSDSIPRVLKNHNFRVDIFPKIDFSMYYDETIASNLIPKPGSGKSVRSEIAFLYDVSLFRQLPQVLKKRIHNNQEWLLKVFFANQGSEPAVQETKIHPKRNVIQSSRAFSEEMMKRSADLRFIGQMLSQADTDSERYTFKYYHLSVPHWPLILDENLEYKKMPINRESYKRYCKAGLKIMGMFLYALKEMAIYDNTMILIMGDHGASNQGQRFELQNGMPIEAGLQPIRDRFKTSALPLLLVKPFSSRGPLKISDAPVSLSDIPRTVFSEVGVETEATGKSIFTLKEKENRERRFFLYGRKFPPYYGDMIEYIVSGYVWDDRAWNRSGRMYTKEGIRTLEAKEYKYGSKIYFGRGGDAIVYQGHGWSTPSGGRKSTDGKKGQTWTDGKEAELTIPVRKTTSDLRIIVKLSPFLVSEKINKQRVTIFVNDFEIGQWSISKNGKYSIVIPNRVVQGNILKIAFKLPDADSPLNLGSGEDSRLLGINVGSLVIEET